MPSANKGKSKGRDARQSRSRNTTPSSSLSAGPTSVPPPSSYLENDPSRLLVPMNVQYSEMLDRMGAGPVPDIKSLESLMDHLKSLSQLAESRGDACNAGMRELSQKRKEIVEDQEQFDLDVSERLKVKREADNDEESGRASKGGKVKKRKERDTKEDRPLALGAHDMTRQDGAETKVEGGKLRSFTLLRNTSVLPCFRRSRKPIVNSKLLTPETAASPASKRSKNAASDGTSSSLSPPSLTSPKPAPTISEGPAPVGSPMSDGTAESHQPEPAPTVPQVQVFGPNPLKFDDPTIYHIREVAPGMTDEEKKDIYGVARFPSSDLSHLMAGIPPDKDFSNAKPTNQVSANTFLAYIEPFVRPLTEEDMAFLKEKVGLIVSNN